jgi:hypothetical protein
LSKKNQKSKQMSGGLAFLPRDILSFITNYFLEKDDQNKKIFQFTLDWRNLMNTNQQYFGEWKKESQLVVVSGYNAERFYSSVDFREKIYRIVESPRLQVDLVFNYSDFYSGKNPTIDFTQLNNVRTISIEKIMDSCKIVPCKTTENAAVSLRRCPFPDLSYWATVKEFNFTPHNSIRSHTFDLNPLRNIEKANLKISQCVNYHVLSNLKSLTISGCESITDVSCFQNIPDLDLRKCSGITDVSSLGRVHSLCLAGCDNITDVSALARVYKLNLSHCEKVTDLSKLEWVHTFAFDGFQGEDLSGLKSVVILNISDSPNVSDVTMLTTLKGLVMAGSYKIKNLTGLVNLRELLLIGQSRITMGREIFKQLTRLVVYCPSLPFKPMPFSYDFVLSLDDSLRHLSIDHYVVTKEFPMLMNLHSLTISSCEYYAGDFVVPFLPRLGYLKILSCSIKFILIRGGDSSLEELVKYPLYKVVIDQCFTDKLQIDRKVSHCHIGECEDLNVLEFNQQIGFLKSERRFDKIINQSWVIELDLGDNPAERTITENDELLLDYEKYLAEKKGTEKKEEGEDDEDDGYEEESDESNF